MLPIFEILIISLSIINVNSQNGKNCTNEYGNKKFNGECMQINDCVGGAFRGDCNAVNYICCVKDIDSTYSPVNSAINQTLFLKLAGNTTRNRALYKYFAESLELAKINTPNRAAAYFATLVSESNYFREFESPINDEDSNFGNTDPGDGFLYRGRGAIFVRGKDNYKLANKSRLNFDFDLIKNPERAVFPSVAFKMAYWFWSENAFIITSNGVSSRGNLNDLVDGTFHNFSLLTHSLTNDLQKLKERAIFNDLVLNELEKPAMKRGQGIECDVSGHGIGYAVPICLTDFKKPYCGCDGIEDRRSCPYGLVSGNKCRSPSIIKCCKESNKNIMDLVLLIDSSGSISIENFNKTKQFAISLLSNFALNPNETRVAIAHFNSLEYELMNFKNFYNFSTVKDAILGIPEPFGGTNTARVLEYTNIRLMQEDNGMRDITTGVPKSIIVITDGESDNSKATIKEANLLKERGFNMITVGLGDLFTNEIELIQMASSPKDAYKINEYDKLSLYLSSLARSTIQQPARINQELEINFNLPENSYNYFKCPLDKKNLEETQFTVSLEYKSGYSDLFFSFVDSNPKNEKDFIEQSSLPIEFDQNFVETSFSPTVLPKYSYLTGSRYDFNGNFIKNSYEVLKNTVIKYYSIKIPENQTNFSLFIGARGNVDDNNLKVFVYNRTIDFNNTSPSNLPISTYPSTDTHSTLNYNGTISFNFSTSTIFSAISPLSSSTTKSNINFSVSLLTTTVKSSTNLSLPFKFFPFLMLFPLFFILI